MCGFRVNRIALAAITGAHGVRGEVRLKLFTDSAANLAAHDKVFVLDRPLRLERIAGAGRNVVARFAGVSSRDAAEALRGALIEVDRSALPPLGDGEYYHADLIGLPCHDQEGNAMGTVASVENYGAGDLLEVESAEGRRSLIPFRPGIADLENGRIILDPAFLA